MSGLLCAPRGAPALRLPFVSARSVVLSVPPGAVRRMHAAPRATQPALRPSLLRCSAPRTGSVPQPAAPAPDSPALSEQDYHDAADSTLDELQDRFDAFIEAVPDLVQDPEARVEEWDVEVAVRTCFLPAMGVRETRSTDACLSLASRASLTCPPHGACT